MKKKKTKEGTMVDTEREGCTYVQYDDELQAVVCCAEACMINTARFHSLLTTDKPGGNKRIAVTFSQLLRGAKRLKHSASKEVSAQRLSILR